MSLIHIDQLYMGLLAGMILGFIFGVAVGYAKGRWDEVRKRVKAN